MTIRDAIEILEEVKTLDDSMYAYNPAYMDALDIALTALEAEEDSSPENRSRLEEAIMCLTPENQYDFLYWLMFDYGRRYTDSRTAIIEWLKGDG